MILLNLTVCVRRSAPLRTQKRFSTDVCKHTPVENFFGSLDTGQAVELVGMII